MSKPWDKLRKPPVNVDPIGSGSFNLSNNTNPVNVAVDPMIGGAELKFSGSNFFTIKELRNLAEFASILADEAEAR